MSFATNSTATMPRQTRLKSVAMRASRHKRSASQQLPALGPIPIQLGPGGQTRQPGRFSQALRVVYSNRTGAIAASAVEAAQTTRFGERATTDEAISATVCLASGQQAWTVKSPRATTHAEAGHWQAEQRTKLPELPERRTGQDRRAFPRRESGCTVSVRRRSTGTNSAYCRTTVAWHLTAARCVGDLIDISMNGAAFLLGEALEDGSVFDMRLSNPHFDQHVDTSGRVIRCTPIAGSQFKIVCQFPQNLTFEQVHQFGKKVRQSNFV